jgi:hypothetical protein
MNKDNKNTKVDKTDKKLNISDVSSSVYNGFRSNYPISDDLEDLKRRYTPEQLQKMWDGCYPKSSEISDNVFITYNVPQIYVVFS